ncbi:LysR family transcriptional regulator [Colwelliaceae bacterium 6471]
MGRRKAAISGQLTDIDLRLLKVFKSVVDSGGYTAAEMTLNLANSTISNYIADLEKRLDMRLCERGRAGFKLTEHGQVVYQATLDLLSSLDEFRSTINQSHNRIFGHLHLGFAEHMLGAHSGCVIDAIEKFTAQAPDVNVQISTLSSDEVTTAVLDKKVDIGITVLSEHYPELDSLSLFHEEMVLYCGEGHPLFNKTDAQISTEELRQYKFVESPRLMLGREPHADMKHWHKPAKAHHQEARAMLILSGSYLGILPKHLVNKWGFGNQLKPLFINQYGYKNSFRAIRRKQHGNALITDIFYQCLHDAKSLEG